jgi:hypothetical protein
MVTVYSSIKSPRFYYAVKLVLEQVGGLDYQIVHTKENLEEVNKVINYSVERIEGSFQVHPYGLLSEKDYRKFDVSFDYGGEEKLKLFLTEFDDLGFDVFSAAFFLASRFEEYWKFKPDEHGRYTSVNSVLHKLGVLHLPLINIWAKVLLKKLSIFFKEEHLLKSQFKIINTIDVDNAWAYKNKGVYRSFGGISRAILKGNFAEVMERVKTLAFGKSDPYDTYNYINKVTKEKQVESIYFFLLGNRAEYDKNVSHQQPKLIALIKNLSKQYKIGLHPSYQSYLNLGIQKQEKERLEKITGSEVTLARKHFLKLSIPETYRIFEKVGIKEDYTMGYADNVGFRAGICTPFSFFDVLEDKETSLVVHPFAYMDGTLNQYLKLNREESIQKIKQLKTEVEAVQGEFIGVWHNETLNDQGIWKGWKAVYEAGL